MVKTVLVGLVTFALLGSAYAAPDKAPERSLVGTYVCEGTNPDGAGYTGIVDIIKHHDAYLVRWSMPDDTQVVGIGILSGGHPCRERAVAGHLDGGRCRRRTVH
jgi:hypothetical protein